MFGRSLKFGRSGDRTRDLMLSSATLYQLSYAAMFMFDVGQLLVSSIHIRDVIGSGQTAVRVGLGNLRLQSVPCQVPCNMYIKRVSVKFRVDFGWVGSGWVGSG